VRLTQVLGNLLNNAAKYTNHGGTITLSARREGDTAVISVRDNGCGITTAGLERIFEMFSREVHAGLAICTPSMCWFTPRQHRLSRDWALRTRWLGRR